MARLLDQPKVIDVESACWEGVPPAGQSSEITEIGLAMVDLKRLERQEKHATVIRPVHSEISTFCTQLTALTAADLADAGTRADAVRVLKKEYRSADRMWASWGDYDRRQFERVCREANVGYPFGTSHLNAKTLFAVVYSLEREVGMDAACELTGQLLEGTHHRGVDDAWNIAGLLGGVLRKLR